MNTHESYVSFETAKLLKQAGFDWETINAYGQDEGLYGTIGISRNFNAEKGFIAAPSLAVAQKWLREVKHKEIQAGMSCAECKYRVFIVDLEWLEAGTRFYGKEDTYESALEAGINKCLTLLLKEN